MANQSKDIGDAVRRSNLQKYGVPFYAAAWVPYSHVRSKFAEEREGSDDAESSSQNNNYVVLAGGGGEGRSGIPNAIIVSHADIGSKSLSDQPVSKLTVRSDLPYRMAVHPGGDGLICALPNSCRIFEWQENKRPEVHKLGVKASEKVLTELKDVGQQVALVFNEEGSMLAAGGEDGTLRVFKWPSMEAVLNEAKVHSSVKDLTFSSNGKYLVSLGAPSCRVWDVKTSTIATTLSKEKDEIFAFCRFSQISGNREVLHVAAMTDRGGSIITWNTTTWKRLWSKRVTGDAISAFNVSADEGLLAIGTIQGDVLVLDSTTMKIQQMVKKAHLGFVTALTFSEDSRALLSTSMDSSARLTLIEDPQDEEAMGLWVIIFVILLAMAVFFVKSKEIIR